MENEDVKVEVPEVEVTETETEAKPVGEAVVVETEPVEEVFPETDGTVDTPLEEAN